MDEVGERRERKDMRRNLERVLRAAQDLFAEHGDDVTMEEVARRAGVGVGTIYRKFPSKEQLFAAVSNQACTNVRHYLFQAIEDTQDPIGKLRALVIIQYRWSAEHAALLDLRPPMGKPEICESPFGSQQLYATMHHLLGEIIVEGQQRGIIRQGNPAALATLCLELLTPRAFQHLSQVVGGTSDEVAEYTIRFMLSGLGER